MIRGLIAKKVGMTQIFNKEGDSIAVTVLEAGPCTVLEVKETPKKVKLGFEPIKETKVQKPVAGYFKKIGVAPMRIIKEFVSTDNAGYTVGQQLKADFFKPGDFVDVQGTSIGKGFQGGMKRWNWSGGNETRGSMHHRRIGSNGSSADPSRTFRGHHMPGHMGADTVSSQGLRVMDVDAENNLVLVKGAVPGHSGSILFIKRSQKKAFRSFDEVKVVVAHKVNPMKQSKAKAKGK